MTRTTPPRRETMTAAALLMNAVIYPFLVCWTLAALVVAAVAVPGAARLTKLSLHEAMRLAVWVYGRVWLGAIYPFLRFRREGFTPEVGATPSVFVVNHQSFFDTYFMGALPFYNVSFAIRSWPFRMWWYRPVMRIAQYLDVESLPHDQTLARAKELLGQGCHILFFPEGHRSRDGKLGRFYAGAFRIAAETGAPLVPLVLDGTGTLLPPGRKWMRPASVTLTALDPIDAAGFGGELGHRKLLKTAKERIEATLARTSTPAAPPTTGGADTEG